MKARIFVLFGLALAPRVFAAPAMEIYLYGEKPGITAQKPLDGKNPIRLHVARNGFAMLIVRLPAETPRLVPLEGVGFVKTPKGGHKPALSAYAIGVQKIERSSYLPSTPAGLEAPDILVPNELLSRKEFHLPPRNVPARPLYLFELHVPESNAAGEFPSSIRFRRAGTDFQIPLLLRVHVASLPPKLALKTSFGFAPWGAMKKHFGEWVNREADVFDAYASLAAEHRIDLHNSFSRFPKVSELKEGGGDLLAVGGSTSFVSLWKRSQAPRFTRFGFSPSMTNLPVPEEEKKQPTEAFWKALQASVEKNGLLDQVFVYFIDEPKPSDYGWMKESLRKIHQFAPKLKQLGTLTYQKALEGAITLWCPNLVEWNWGGHAPPAAYEARRAAGEDFWVYTSCNAHGCGGHPQDSSLPDLVTDRPAAFHRAFAWSAFHTKAGGVLYYNTVENYGSTDDSPWKDPFIFGGNGEGTLFYPCNRASCGTDSLVVLPSLRLKSIRDGLEDIEILGAGERAGLPVREWERGVMKGIRSFARDAEAYERVKIRVLEGLDGKK